MKYSVKYMKGSEVFEETFELKVDPTSNQKTILGAADKALEKKFGKVKVSLLRVKALITGNWRGGAIS